MNEVLNSCCLCQVSRWIGTGSDTPVEKYYQCSNCGASHYSKERDLPSLCPNCHVKLLMPWQKVKWENGQSYITEE